MRNLRHPHRPRIRVRSLLTRASSTYPSVASTSPTGSRRSCPNPEPVICTIEGEDGYATFGTPEAYAMRMLFVEIHALTDGWRLLPSPCYKRDAHGRVIHETRTQWTAEEDFTANDRILCPPPRIRGGAARVTEINLRADQLPVIDYRDQAGETAMVGVSRHASKRVANLPAGH
jgi:hypothetical protein